jgi:two-component sensor histidine kinase
VDLALAHNAAVELDNAVFAVSLGYVYIDNGDHVICDSHGPRPLYSLPIHLRPMSNPSNGDQETTHGPDSDLRSSSAGVSERELELLTRVRNMEILLREVHHRVKSNLQVVVSLLTMQASTTTDPALGRSLEEAATRVSTVALVHADLSESATLAAVDLSTSIRRLVANVQQIFGYSAASVTFALDDISLPIELATPCALIVNELVTNAFRYAFTGSQAPRIEIRAGALDGIATIVVHDNGTGRPGTRTRDEPHGLGLSLMKMLAVKQLRGALTVLTSATGTEFTVTFPCDTGGKHGPR